jgi:nucleotide sugar dehydrogenase
VVSGATAACAESAASILSHVSGGIHLVSSLEVAEMAKLLENTFRAVNISLANEMADAAHHLGIDPVEVIKAAATKPFGFMPFYPGPGVGGHCIPCDPHYLLWQLRRERIHPAVISAAMQSISTRPDRIVDRAAEAVGRGGRGLSGSQVLVIGVTYKANVADTRESPAFDIISGLSRRGANVSVHDPLVPSIVVDGHQYTSQSTIDMADYDLVVVCSMPSHLSDEEFQRARIVLDATYRLPEAANRVVP